jgi:phosphoribosylanthranilate isomerase
VNNRYYPQIKVCGLTRADEAVACAEQGADAIGLVFYPASPRNVTIEQAAAITAQLPTHVAAVGVFVDPEMALLTRAISQCGLHGVQLHGSEPPSFVAALAKAVDTKIIKVLFTSKPPALKDAGGYDVTGYLVECGRGRLPGGNAMIWDWSLAESFGRNHPLILAGGLGPDTVSQAIAACRPDAVDASSGLEVSPGRKDLAKVTRFIHAVHQTEDGYRDCKRAIRFIF